MVILSGHWDWGMRWQQRLCFEKILPVMICAVLPDGREMPGMRVGFWRWRGFTVVMLAVPRPGLAALACKPFATGCYGSMPRAPDGLIDDKAPGQPSKLNDGQRQALAAIIESGPIPAVYGVVRWRLIDLAQWIWEEPHLHRQADLEPGIARPAGWRDWRLGRRQS